LINKLVVIVRNEIKAKSLGVDNPDGESDKEEVLPAGGRDRCVEGLGGFLIEGMVHLGG
jgi:hypothetical protein